MLREEKWTLKKHLPYQAFYLAFYAGYMPVLLFLPLYLKYVGLSTTQVGLITGLRPLLQAIGTPILIKLSTRFRARKLLFILSCILMIGKFFMIFVVLRPDREVCRIKYDNGQIIKDRFVNHIMTRRSVVIDEWLQVMNFTPNYLSFENYDTNDSISTNKNASWSTIRPKTIQSSGGPALNELTNSTVSPTLNHTSIAQYQFEHAADVHHIFIAIIILTVAIDVFDACIFTLVDDVYRPNVAWVWGDMAWGVIAVVIGVIVDASSKIICGELIGSFHYVFYFNLGFVGAALLIGFCLDLTLDPYEVDMTRKIHSSKWNFQYSIFILAYTLMGFCNGFLFSFVYWFIDILGGNAIIMGLSTSTECLVGFLVFFLFNKLIEYIGHMSAVCGGFVGYIGLFLSYYGVKNPWLVIPVKVLQALVSGIMMFAINSFLKVAAPAGSSYQMQDTLHGIYLAIGTTIGAVFSGHLIDNFYFKTTFLCFTLVTCAISFLFLGVQLFIVCSEGKSDSDFASESSLSGSSQFGDDEDDLGSVDEPKW